MHFGFSKSFSYGFARMIKYKGGEDLIEQALSSHKINRCTRCIFHMAMHTNELKQLDNQAVACIE